MFLWRIAKHSLRNIYYKNIIFNRGTESVSSPTVPSQVGIDQSTTKSSYNAGRPVQVICDVSYHYFFYPVCYNCNVSKIRSKVLKLFQCSVNFTFF